jgi:hypothetical protein
MRVFYPCLCHSVQVVSLRYAGEESYVIFTVHLHTVIKINRYKLRNVAKHKLEISVLKLIYFLCVSTFKIHPVSSSYSYVTAFNAEIYFMC